MSHLNRLAPTSFHRSELNLTPLGHAKVLAIPSFLKNLVVTQFDFQIKLERKHAGFLVGIMKRNKAAVSTMPLLFFIGFATRLT